MKLKAFRDDEGRLRILRRMPEGEIPTELVLFDAGVTETSKGNVLFDALSAEMTMTRYEEHGQEELPFDYNHGMLSFVTTPEGSKAAGWFTPEVRDGALVASRIEWTPAAKKGLEDKEWRFFSPAILQDDDGRVARLVNVALTNLPATKHQRPLVAHDVSADRPPQAERKHETMDEILKLLGVTTEAEAIAKLSQLSGLLQLLLSETGKSTQGDAIEQIRSWKKEAGTATELADKVRKLENERSETEREALITELNDQGKLPQSLFGWARTQTKESLEAFGKDAPVSKRRENHDPPDGDSITTLSEVELQACRLLGMTRAQYVEAKKQKAEDDERMRAEREGRVL